MKNRHETRKGIVYKNRHHAKLLVDEIEVEEALYDLYGSDPEPNWDNLAEISEMSDFAERGLRIF